MEDILYGDKTIAKIGFSQACTVHIPPRISRICHSHPVVSDTSMESQIVPRSFSEAITHNHATPSLPINVKTRAGVTSSKNSNKVHPRKQKLTYPHYRNN